MKTCFIDRESMSIADVSQNPVSGVWDLNRINVPAKHRGRGIGRKLMAEVLAEADREGIELELDINPYGELDHDDLAAWYGRCGFVFNGTRWVREPKRA